MQYGLFGMFSKKTYECCYKMLQVPSGELT